MKFLRNVWRTIERWCSDYNRPTPIRKIGEAIYWIRAHTFNRYHILNLGKVLPDYYEWGWIDTDTKILLANFGLFNDFMTKEYPGMIDWDWETQEGCASDELIAEKRTRHQIMKDLHHWWTVERPANMKLLDEMSHKAYEGKLYESVPIEDGMFRLDRIQQSDEKELLMDIHRLCEQAFEEQDTKMLHDLIDIRFNLWT